MLGCMVVTARIIAAVALMGLVSACAPTLGPPPPHTSAPPPSDARFSADAFAWAQVPGRNALAGRLAFKAGGVAYSCTGSTVVLTPETPWSRLRISVLYKSDVRSALPAAEVRARTPMAPPGDSGPFIRRTSCDAGDHFSFTGLPDGAWYVVTIAKPAPGGTTGNMAFMRRVTTKGGRVNTFDL